MNFSAESHIVGMRVWVFVNGPGDLGSIQGLKKWYLMPLCLTLRIIRYGLRVKWSNPGQGVAPSPTPWCSSYRKGSLWVALDCGCQLYFFYFTNICSILFSIVFTAILVLKMTLEFLDAIGFKQMSYTIWSNTRVCVRVRIA